MQCEEKLRLLRKIQIQMVAAELEKAEAKNWWRRCVKKWEVATMSYFNDHQRLWTDIMEQQRKRLASIIAAALHLYARLLSEEKRTSLGTSKRHHPAK